MRKDIREYYSALNLSPGATPLQIKRAYRQLMRRWHPDLFKPGSVMQMTAEDIAKEVNEAFDQLIRKQLYRKFPPKEEKKPEGASRAGQADEEESGLEKPPPAKSPKAQPRTARRPRPRAAARKPAKPGTGIGWRIVRKMRRWPWRTAAAVAALAVAGMVIRREVPAAIAGPEASVLQSTPSAPSAAKAPQRIVVAMGMPAEAPRRIPKEEVRVRSALEFQPSPPPSYARAVPMTREPFSPVAPAWTAPENAFNPAAASRIVEDAQNYLETFGMGDPKSRVAEIQGAPDEAADGVYRYGSSLVYFENGVVSGWSDRQPRLHVRHWPTLGQVSLDTFAVGSTRADVIRAQGQPNGYDATGYRYGSSMIYFHDDIVTDWVQGDTRLHTFAMPKIPYGELDALFGR